MSLTDSVDGSVLGCHSPNNTTYQIQYVLTVCQQGVQTSYRHQMYKQSVAGLVSGQVIIFLML